MGLLLVYLTIIALSGSSVSNKLPHFEQYENTNVQLHDSVPSDLVPWITGPRKKKYQFNIGKQSWLAAREKCLAQNADLVTIESTEELQWLLTHYKPQLPHLRERQVQVGLLLDSPISNSKQNAAAWRWVSGKLLDDQSIMHWAQGKPFDNANGTERCALLNINADAKIDDVDCDLGAGTESNYRFVCERTHEKHIEHESLNNPLWKKLEDILTFFGISGPESDKSLANRTSGLEEEGYWDKVLATSDAFKRPRNSSTELGELPERQTNEINLIAGKKPSGIIIENKMASNAAELADRILEGKNEKIAHDEQRQNANETQNAKKENFDSKTELSAKNNDDNDKKLEAKPPVVIEKIAVGKIVASPSSIQAQLIEPKREEHSVDKAGSLLLDKAQNTVTSAASMDNDGTFVEGVPKPAAEELDGQNGPKLRAFRTRLLTEDPEQEKDKKEEEKVKPANGRKESIRDGDENAKAKTPEQTIAKTEEQIKQLNKAQKEVINAEEINDQDSKKPKEEINDQKTTEEINNQQKATEEIKEKPKGENNDQKKPKEEIEEKVKDEIKEKPKGENNDQKKPKEEIEEKVKDEIKEKPKEEIKEKLKEEIKEKPKEEIKEKPKEAVKDESNNQKPTEEIKEKLKDEIKEKPKEEIKKKLTVESNDQKKPKEEIKEKPKEEIKEKPSVESNDLKKPTEEIKEKPNEEIIDQKKPTIESNDQKKPKEDIKEKPKDEIKEKPKEEESNDLKKPTEEIKEKPNEEIIDQKKATIESNDQKKPKEDIKEKPKDEIKEKPKEEESNDLKKPTEEIKEKPNEEINDQKKPTVESNDQKKPTEEIKEKPKEEINDLKKSKEEIKEKPKDEIKEKPKVEIKEKPKDEIKEKPKDEIKEKPKVEIKEEPKEEIKEKPKEEKEKQKEEINDQKKPNEEIKEKPKDAIKEKPKEEIKEKPKEEVKEKPIVESNNQKPTDEINEKPKEEINDQKKPNEEIKEKPKEAVKDESNNQKPTEEIKEKPKEEIKKKLTDAIKEKPKEEINDQKKPKEEIKEKPKVEIKEKPKEEVKEKPTVESNDQKKPKEDIKEKPKDEIKEKPKEEESNDLKKPTEEIKEKPNEEINDQKKPTVESKDQKKPTEEIKEKPKEESNDQKKPKAEIKEKPKEEKEKQKEGIKEKPKVEIKEKPKEEVKEKPTIESNDQKKPTEEIKEKPKEELKEKPKEEIKEKPKEELKEKPKEEIKEKLTVESNDQKKPKEEIKVKPKEEIKKKPTELITDQNKPAEEIKDQMESKKEASHTQTSFKAESSAQEKLNEELKLAQEINDQLKPTREFEKHSPNEVINDQLMAQKEAKNDQDLLKKELQVQKPAIESTSDQKEPNETTSKQKKPAEKPTDLNTTKEQITDQTLRSGINDQNPSGDQFDYSNKSTKQINDHIDKQAKPREKIREHKNMKQEIKDRDLLDNHMMPSKLKKSFDPLFAVAETLERSMIGSENEKTRFANDVEAKSGLVPDQIQHLERIISAVQRMMGLGVPQTSDNGIPSKGVQRNEIAEEDVLKQKKPERPADLFKEGAKIDDKGVEEERAVETRRKEKKEETRRKEKKEESEEEKEKKEETRRKEKKEESEEEKEKKEETRRKEKKEESEEEKEKKEETRRKEKKEESEEEREKKEEREEEKEKKEEREEEREKKEEREEEKEKKDETRRNEEKKKVMEEKEEKEQKAKEEKNSNSNENERTEKKEEAIKDADDKQAKINAKKEAIEAKKEEKFDEKVIPPPPPPSNELAQPKWRRRLFGSRVVNTADGSATDVADTASRNREVHPQFVERLQSNKSDDLNALHETMMALEADFEEAERDAKTHPGINGGDLVHNIIFPEPDGTALDACQNGTEQDDDEEAVHEDEAEAEQWKSKLTDKLEPFVTPKKSENEVNGHEEPKNSTKKSEPGVEGDHLQKSTTTTKSENQLADHEEPKIPGNLTKTTQNEVDEPHKMPSITENSAISPENGTSLAKSESRLEKYGRKAEKRGSTEVVTSDGTLQGIRLSADGPSNGKIHDGDEIPITEEPPSAKHAEHVVERGELKSEKIRDGDEFLDTLNAKETINGKSSTVQQLAQKVKIAAHIEPKANDDWVLPLNKSELETNEAIGVKSSSLINNVSPNLTSINNVSPNLTSINNVSSNLTTSSSGVFPQLNFDIFRYGKVPPETERRHGEERARVDNVYEQFRTKESVYDLIRRIQQAEARRLIVKQSLPSPVDKFDVYRNSADRTEYNVDQQGNDSGGFITENPFYVKES